jgi:DNA repair exonuclease SbcCD ATPase subunit
MATELKTADIEELAEQHKAMEREISEWREWWHELDEFGEPRFEEMGVRLRRLHEGLAAHFQLEEQAGFFESILRTHPDRSSEVAGFRHQHRELLSALEQLVERLSSPEAGYKTWGAARQDFEKFLNDLHAHEAAEGELGGGVASGGGTGRPST